jgi:hypothetical protein
MDAVGGTIVMAGTIFTPLLAQSRDRLRQVAGVAIGVGLSRMGERMAGAPAHHGEYESGYKQHSSFGTKETWGGFGVEPLVAAAAKL